MKFNETKSKSMIIRRKRRLDKINIFLNNRSLEQVDVMKYLGIHFDSRLLFYKHIEHVAEKSRALTYMLNRTAKLHWGLGHKSLKTIYEGATVPLTYRAPVWEGAITNNKHLQKLDSGQRLINIKLAKAYMTISFEASCVIAGVLPIGLVIDGKGTSLQAEVWTGDQRHSMRHAVASTLMATPSPESYHHRQMKLRHTPSRYIQTGARMQARLGQELSFTATSR
jgi:hypothetical protein